MFSTKVYIHVLKHCVTFATESLWEIKQLKNECFTYHLKYNHDLCEHGYEAIIGAIQMPSTIYTILLCLTSINQSIILLYLHVYAKQ